MYLLLHDSAQKTKSSIPLYTLNIFSKGIHIVFSGHPGAGGKKGGEHRGGLGDGGTRGYGTAFHAARETLVSGPLDVGHEETGTGGAVPD